MGELTLVHDRLMIVETLNRYAWGYDTDAPAAWSSQRSIVR